VLAALGADCLEAPSRMAMYQYFENTIKPAIGGIDSQKDVSFGRAVDELSRHSSEIAFCGHHLEFQELIGNDTNQITLQNRDGIFSKSTMVFEY
jgi:hypothetical protein